MKGFYLEDINFKHVINMFERMDISENIYEVFVEPPYKNILGRKLTVMATEGILGEEYPCQRKIQIWVDILASTRKGM